MSRKKNEKRYPAEVLLESRAMSGYQEDFARVILADKEYTVQEAIEALDKVLKSSEKNEEEKGDVAEA